MQVVSPDTIRLKDSAPALDLVTPVAETVLDIYLEGTDASGKDTVAGKLNHQRQLRLGASARKAASAGYFSPDTGPRFTRWAEQYPDVDESGLLLAATVFDLATISTVNRSATSHVQISHNSIRGTAFQEAFDMPLSDLFSMTNSLLPKHYWPVALTASIPELQRRVKANPLSTPFDFLVWEQPDKIEAMMETIRETCLLLGGKAIDTSLLTPDDVAEHISTEVDSIPHPLPQEPADVYMVSEKILDELQERNADCTPIVSEIKRELYEE